MNIKSDEVQEILGTPPRWIVRYGTILGLLSLLLLGWGSFFFRYPDVVKSDIVISSQEPPRKLVLQHSGFVAEILVHTEDSVQAGQALLVLKSNAKFEDVLTLEDLLFRARNSDDSTLLAFNSPKDLLLGDLQDDLYNFIEKQEALKYNRTGGFENASIKQLKRQIRNAKNSISFEKRRKSNLEQEYVLVNERYVREQNLLKGNLTSMAKVRQLQEDVLSLERSIQGAESNINTKNFEINMRRKEIENYKVGSQFSASSALSEVKDAFIRLQRKVDDWRKDYLVVAPMDGVVLITNQMLSKEQYIPKETELMVVLPINSAGIIGRINLNLNGSGKVKIGQRVVIKLDSYPFESYGAIEGIISYKGKLPHNNRIPVEVSFPNGLITTYDQAIEMSQEMEGSVDIITQQKRLIQWIFERFKRVVS